MSNQNSNLKVSAIQHLKRSCIFVIPKTKIYAIGAEIIQMCLIFNLWAAQPASLSNNMGGKAQNNEHENVRISSFTKVT